MKQKWKKMISMALTFCVLGSSVYFDTGCQKKDKKTEETTEATSVQETNIQLDSTVMAVGNEKISFSEVMFYVYYLEQQYKDGFGKELWNYKMDEETTMEQYVKDQIISEITEVKVISQEAEKAGYSLTAEEENEAKTKASDFLKKVSDNNKKKYGFTEELIQNIYKEHTLVQKTYDIICGQVNTSISDAEVKQITVQVLTVLTNGEDRNGKNIAMDDVAQKTAGKRAKSFLKEAKKVENFYTYAESNSDLETVEYTFGKDDMPKDFGEAAFALKTGEYSSVIEGKNGYYIIYCVSDFDEEKSIAKKEEMIEGEQVKLFQDTYTKWSSDYETVVSKTVMNEIHMGE